MGCKLQDCCVGSSQTLLDAMRVIEAGGIGIALVVETDGKLLGTLTDGDIRRALLGGAALGSPLATFVARRFTSVGVGVSRAEILDLMQARVLNQIPILDAAGKLVGLHLLHEMLGHVNRSNWAVIMAGGKGTRLHPITAHLPKPMIKVAGRPILERLVLHLVGHGIRRVFLAINYMGHVIQQHFGDGSNFGCRIGYLEEQEELGTGGALSLLPEPPREPLLVLNGDLVTQVDIGRMLAFHAASGCVATMGVRTYSHQVPFGCVQTNGPRITGFEEKPVLERMINTGVYLLSPPLLTRIPARFYPITELFDNCLERGEALAAFEIEDDWIDVGQRDQLKQARGDGV